MQGIFKKNNDVVLVLDLGFVSLLTKLRLTVKAVKAFINVSNVSYKSCTLLKHAEKEKYLCEISMFTFTENFSRLI